MKRRVLLFVQSGSDRPKCAGSCWSSVEDGRTPRYSLRWPNVFGTSRMHDAQHYADRWWIVECENADAGREVIARGEVLTGKHERCECGHCRCNHEAGYGGCLAKRDHGAQTCRCERYSWPGRNSEMSGCGRILAQSEAPAVPQARPGAAGVRPPMKHRVLLFVQAGGSRPKSFQTWRTGGTSGTKRAPQRQPVPSGEYIATKRADYWMSLAAFRAFSKAERWWLVECENAEAGRHIISGTPRFDRSGLAVAEPTGRILAARSLRSWIC